MGGWVTKPLTWTISYRRVLTPLPVAALPPKAIARKNARVVAAVQGAEAKVEV